MLSSGITLIAEVKTISPFGFKSNKSFEELFDLANNFGDIISIHTNEKWGGSFDLLKEARKKTSKPILAKGIHETDAEIEKAISCGADFVLVVGRVPKEISSEKLFIEPLTLSELVDLPKNYKAVWNARDLETGKPKKENFSEARKIFEGWLCQASYIKTQKDIVPGANAVLIGENLSNFVKML